MEYNQYMTQAMESIYGDTEHVVEATINHVPKPYEGTEDGAFYMAHLNLTGKIMDSVNTDAKYNVIDAYGFRLDRLIEFMKDQGYFLHGIDQFCRTDSEPKLSISFCLQ
tara:strand:+ start:6295 stop:6621 length:327 start_codon:yes stop_codon:yes gene_type:complete